MTQVNNRIPGVCLNGYPLKDLEYADDTALFTSNLGDLAASQTVYSKKASKIRLKVNFNKTKVMVVSQHPPPPHVAVNGHVIEIVENFVYLGSKINHRGGYYLRNHAKKSLGWRRFKEVVEASLEAS